MGKKKSFIEGNPALQFISEQPTQEATESGTQPPEGYRVNPLYIEKKTKRVQLVLQPSLYAKAEAAARNAGISFNELVHRALQNYTKGE